MDLGTATSPVGETAVALANQVDGARATLGSTRLQLGPAFGDGLATAIAGQEIATFDALGAPFWYDLGNLAFAADRPSLAMRLRDFQHIPADGFSIPLLDRSAEPDSAPSLLRLAIPGASAAAQAGHFALAGRSLTMSLPSASGLTTTALTTTALTTAGLAERKPVSGTALSWKALRSPLSLRAGWMAERQAFLGTTSGGAFGSLASNAVFAGIGADIVLGQWRMNASAEIGSVNARAHGGLLQEIPPLTTSAFALHANRSGSDGSAFRVSLSQPLRVENGHAHLDVPSGRTKAGGVVRDVRTAGLEPGGRQIDLALQWRRPLDLGILRVEAALSRQPGHRRSAAPEWSLLSGWRLSF